MDRRRFIDRFFPFLALGSILLVGGGCEKYQHKQFKKFGNQEKLWQLAAGQEKLEEPVDLAYAKDTPVLYRDASMGKVDPNFVPRLTGG
ncbi:MAG: hypothetical protein KG012_13020 [Deltaproteobacteria bacterium]|nr:hypothetical protein [Deltaproteobacteria bacterium]